MTPARPIALRAYGQRRCLKNKKLASLVKPRYAWFTPFGGLLSKKEEPPALAAT